MRAPPQTETPRAAGTGRSAYSSDQHQHPTRELAAAPTPGPLFVGPGNCEAVTGLPWRWLRDTLRARGLEPLRVGAKPLYRAADVVRELEAAACNQAAAEPAAEPEPLTDEQEQQAIARRLGLVRGCS